MSGIEPSQISAMNLSGVGINSLGVMWYALEKFLEHKAREAKIHQSVLMDQAEQGNRIEKAGSSGESKLVVRSSHPEVIPDPTFKRMYAWATYGN